MQPVINEERDKIRWDHKESKSSKHRQNAPLSEGRADAMVNNVPFLPGLFEGPLITMHLWFNLQVEVFEGGVTEAKSKLKAWRDASLKNRAQTSRYDEMLIIHFCRREMKGYLIKMPIVNEDALLLQKS